jgi:phage shock protein PspC (stress-responsive transcriptional regulator)
MEAHDQDPTQPDQAPEPRRLLRSQSDKVIGGVCSGVARYFNLDPTAVRIAAVVLALLGGVGVVLYLAGLLLMPSDTAVPGPEGDRNRTLTIVAVVVLLLVAWPLIIGAGLLVAGIVVPLAFLVLAGLLTWWLASGEGPSGSGRDIARRSALGIGLIFLCGLVFIGGAWAAAAGGGGIAAGLVIGAGVTVLAGAFLGRVRWLILPALTLALAVGFVSAAGIDLDGGVGERRYQPSSASQIKDRYQLGMGELVVDLSKTELPVGDTPVAFDVGVGDVQLIVPKDVCVATRAEVGMGAVVVFGHENGGVDLDWEDRPRAPAGKSRVVVDADLGVGAVEIRHTGVDRFAGRRDHGPFGRHESDQDRDSNTGCAGEITAAGGGSATSG